MGNCFSSKVEGEKSVNDKAPLNKHYSPGFNGERNDNNSSTAQIIARTDQPGTSAAYQEKTATKTTEFHVNSPQKNTSGTRARESSDFESENTSHQKKAVLAATNKKVKSKQNDKEGNKRSPKVNGESSKKRKDGAGDTNDTAKDKTVLEKDKKETEECLEILKRNLKKLETKTDFLGRYFSNNIESMQHQLPVEKKDVAGYVPSTEVTAMYAEMGDMREEKDKLLNKLSSVAGDRLRNDNPGITDLSDPNRPGKISEHFSELYDNEWTNVMEVLTEKSNQGDDDELAIIKFLLKTLVVCYEKCVQYSKEQLEDILTAFWCAHTKKAVDSKQAPKSCKEYQKAIAETSIKCLKDNTPSSKLEKAIGEEHKEIFKMGDEQDSYGVYIRKCLELCWYMRIQDPPVCIAWEGGEKPRERFRPYTKSGTELQFVVWPVVFLHENGPILYRGIAQFKKVPQIEKTHL